MTKGDDDQKDIAKQFSSIKWRGDDLRDIANHLRWQARQARIQQPEPEPQVTTPADDSPMPIPSGKDAEDWIVLFDWIYSHWKWKWTLAEVANATNFAHGTVKYHHHLYTKGRDKK